MTTGDIVHSLKKCLSTVERQGDFSCGGDAEDLPDPEISIQGTSRILFPLTPHSDSLRKIKSVGKVAPFGKGMDTITDENVRKALQIDADKISFGNPQWNRKLQILVDDVSQRLGCVGNVHAVLYKALFYEKGGHFKFHKDTEKEKRMFGTLIIQLPSIYKGGDFVTRHNGEEHRHRFVNAVRQNQEHENNKLQFAAHYADVEHCLEEITSGYRFVLAYSLVWDSPGAIPSARMLNSPTLEIQNALYDWSETTDETIGVLLEHEYTLQGAENGVDMLKGYDRTVFDQLNSANAQLDPMHKLRFFLVELTRKTTGLGISGDPEYRDLENMNWEPLWDSQEADTWIDQYGSNYEYAIDFDLKLKDLISLNPGIDISRMDWWGESVKMSLTPYTGNEGPYKNEVYHRYALVIVSAITEYKVLSKDAGAIGGFVALNKMAKDGMSATDLLPKFSKLNTEWQQNRRYSTHNDMKRLRILDSAQGARMNQMQRSRISTSLLGGPDNEVIAKLAIAFAIESRSLEMAKEVRFSILKLILEHAVEFYNLDFTPLVNCFGWEQLNTLDLILLLPNRFEILNSLFDYDLLICTQELKNKIYKSWVEDWEADDVGSFYSVFMLFRKLNFNSDEVATFAISTLAIEDIKQLIQPFIDGVNLVAHTDTSLRCLIIHRLVYVKKQVERPVSEFSWKMSLAKIHEYPILSAFLQSEQQEIIYTGFKGLPEARKWVTKVFEPLKQPKTFSAKATPTGRGKSAAVQVVKDKRHYEYLNKMYEGFSEEKQRLIELLGE